MKTVALLLIFAISALGATSYASGSSMAKLPCGKIIETKGQSLHADRTAFYPGSKSLAKQNGPGVHARN